MQEKRGKCTETTSKNTRCKNNASVGNICMFHMRKKLKEVNREFAASEGIARRDTRAFWTVMCTALLVFGICLLIRYYFGIDNLPRW